MIQHQHTGNYTASTHTVNDTASTHIGNYTASTHIGNYTASRVQELTQYQHTQETIQQQ